MAIPIRRQQYFLLIRFTITHRIVEVMSIHSCLSARITCTRNTDDEEASLDVLVKDLKKEMDEMFVEMNSVAEEIDRALD